MSEIVPIILVQLSLLVIFAAFMAYIFYKIKQPIILAFVIIGLILGPNLLNIIEDPTTITVLSEIGIAFLIYAVGAELDFKKLKALNHNIIYIGVIQILLTALFSFLAVKLLSFSTTQALFFSAILAMSSTTIVIKYLTDKHLVNTLEGKISIGILLIQDAFVILFLPILTNIKDFGPATIGIIILKLAIIVISALLLNYLVFNTMIRESSKNDDLIFLIIVASCFAFIALAVMLDFSIVIATFIGGLIIANYPYNLEIIDRIKEMKMFFSMFFFILLGLQITSIKNIDLLLFLILAFITFVIKPFVLYVSSIAFAYGKQSSFFVGISLAQISEFGLVLTQIAAIEDIFSTKVATTVILFIALAMVLTPYFIKYYRRIFIFSEKYFFIDKIADYVRKVLKIKKKSKLIDKKLKDHIILLGAGRMGETIAEALLKSDLIDNKKLIIVDNDPEPVLRLIEKGAFAISGHADNEEILREINIKDAKLVITTIPFFDVNKEVFKHIDTNKTDVIVRAHFINDALEYYKMGATYVIVPAVLASNQIIKEIFKVIKGTKSDVWQDLYKEYLRHKE